MYGRINISQMIFTMVFVVVLITVSTVFMTRQGTIVINLPYKLEYNNCQSENYFLETQLSECGESKIPVCPTVEVDCGGAGKYWSVIGAIFGLAGYGLYFYALHKAGKLNNGKKKKKPNTP